MAAPSSILREDTEVLLRYAWPSPLLGYAGTMAVGLISALSCFEVSPRILQSLAEDRAIRVLSDWELNKVGVWGLGVLGDASILHLLSRPHPITHSHIHTYTRIQTQTSPFPPTHTHSSTRGATGARFLCAPSS